MNDVKLLEDLLETAKKISYDNKGEFDRLEKRTEMLIRKLFGDESHYIKELKNISYTPMIISSRTDWKPPFESGLKQFRNLIQVMLEDKKLSYNYLPPPEYPEHRQKKWWGYVVGLGVVISILGGIAEFSGCNLKDLFFGSGADDTFTVTVFVHGQKGIDDRILKNQGQVMLGLHGNEMACSVNEKGEATFKGIPMSFKGKRVPIRIDHPQPYRATRPDSLYLLKPSGAIYVEVALEGTNRLFGKVTDFDTKQWLDSVRVSIENVATYTDQYGWFELLIPENKQRKFQRVSFYKKGYKIVELDSIPVHTQKEVKPSLRKIK